MSPEFSLNPETAPALAPTVKPGSPEEKALWERILKLRLKPQERDRLESLLLARLKEHKAKLDALWDELNGHWGYEDGFYRYYHGSFKVYVAQGRTEKAVVFFRELLPERELNDNFMTIIRDGTGKEFDLAHNAEWSKHTRPILEAFTHARFMVEMCVRYADLPAPPHPLPSGWAVVLYLFNLR